MLPLWDFNYRLFQLSLDSQAVITARMMRFMCNHPSCESEALRMVEEKFAAFGRASVHAALGGTYEATLSDLERRVRANRKRLTGV